MQNILACIQFQSRDFQARLRLFRLQVSRNSDVRDVLTGSGCGVRLDCVQICLQISRIVPDLIRHVGGRRPYQMMIRAVSGWLIDEHHSCTTHVSGHVPQPVLRIAFPLAQPWKNDHALYLPAPVVASQGGVYLPPIPITSPRRLRLLPE